MLRVVETIAQRGAMRVPARNFGVNEKAVKIRMKAVGSIGKITKAMKMVASSKMRSDIARLVNGKNFGVGVADAIFENDANVKKRMSDAAAKKVLLVPITSDRGLCGGINSNIIRDIRGPLAEERSKYSIICIGDKGAQALSRPFPDLLKECINEIATPLNFYNVASVANYIISSDYEYDSIVLVYNEFINSLSSKVQKRELMSRANFLKNFSRISRFEVSEPDADFSKNYFYELYVASNLYNCMLHNAACEQSARMNAMENASKNAQEILTALTLEYNKARQARITMELVEIISGASAL